MYELDFRASGFARSGETGMVEASDIKKILYITMSNLGDVMMALPAFDFLRRECPLAKITVVAGPRTKCVFEHHPAVHDLIVYDKHASLFKKMDLFFRLKREEFDVVVDLRDTFYRWGLRAKRKNPAWLAYPAWVLHSSQKHLFKAIVTLWGRGTEEDEFQGLNSRRNPSFISLKDQDDVEKLLLAHQISKNDEFVLVVPGALSDLKKWTAEGFAQVVGEIRRKYGLNVVVAGDQRDQPLVRKIVQSSGGEAVDLSGKTDFGQLCSVIQRAKLVICNDSGVLHIASYLDRPIVGIYGPSDYREYGPWSKRGLVARKSLLCAPCGKAHCRYDRECIETLTPYDVMLAVRLILESEEAKAQENKYRRILVVRTDRIGDVILSTPVIKALRDHYPTSFLAMMVSPLTKDLVDGNPYLDRVIVFDKDKRHRGFLQTLAFSNELKKYGFDVVIVLHPTVRVHLVCFLAGIKERIGYDRKAPYFLTQAFPHKKQEGLKHESEYNLDLLKPLGISTISRDLHVPIQASSEHFVEKLLKEQGMTAREKLVAVNPAASCVSKLWPLKKFAEVIDCLIALDRVKVLVVTDSAHSSLSCELMKLTKKRPIDFSGQLNLSQLASLFKRCALVISNDSGPVHLSVAVGTPVIVLFGRNQPGLGPLRWGPLGPLDVILHKQTDCRPCLAHDCVQKFKCLEAISVEEVLEHAGRFLMERVHHNQPRYHDKSTV